MTAPVRPAAFTYPRARRFQRWTFRVALVLVLVAFAVIPLWRSL